MSEQTKNKKISDTMKLRWKEGRFNYRILKGIPHIWNKNKKGTFVKGHKHSLATKIKISKTVMNRYTKEQRSEKELKARLSQKTNKTNTKIELKVQNALSLLNIGFISNYRKGRFIFDIFVPEINAYIECDGRYWHSLPGNIQADKRKEQFCKENNLLLFRFKEEDINKNLIYLIKTLPNINIWKN